MHARLLLSHRSLYLILHEACAYFYRVIRHAYSLTLLNQPTILSPNKWFFTSCVNSLSPWLFSVSNMYFFFNGCENLSLDACWPLCFYTTVLRSSFHAGIYPLFITNSWERKLTGMLDLWQRRISNFWNCDECNFILCVLAAQYSLPYKVRHMNEW